MSNNHSDTGAIGLVTVILALVFLFVWPGPFRYQYVLEKPGPVVRIDRITGKAFVLSDGKYRQVTEAEGSTWKTSGRDFAR